MFFTAEREKFLLYSKESIFDFRQYFYVKKDSKIKFNGDYNALKNYVIGARIGFSYGEEFDQVLKNKTLKVKRISDTIQNVKLLDIGRIDMFIGNPMNAVTEFKAEKRTQIPR